MNPASLLSSLLKLAKLSHFFDAHGGICVFEKNMYPFFELLKLQIGSKKIKMSHLL